MGPKTFIFVRLSPTSRLNGEYLLNKTRYTQSGNGVEKSYIVPKLYELWSTNGLKPDRSFTHPHYFVPSQSIAHCLSGINVSPHIDCKWNGIGFFLQVRFEALKEVELEMLPRWAALSGNTSLLALPRSLHCVSKSSHL